jgi:hypothetical protein
VSKLDVRHWLEKTHPFGTSNSFTNNKNYSSVAITNKSDIAEKRIEDSHGYEKS